MDTKAGILIVDDRPEKVIALEAILEELGQSIVRAYSGREALRHVLERDFAVILLDVNMPGMDGFETAALIRQRSNSRHTPIIFITAFDDELRAMRGYSLGAVDYILTPVLPEVLRTKVAVFVELFVKTEQVKRQAESLQRRASQMQKLASASLTISSALSIERILQSLAETARDIIGAHQSIAVYSPETAGGRAPSIHIAGSFSEKYASWREKELRINSPANSLFDHIGSVIRLTAAEVEEHQGWENLAKADLPPISGGVIAAPLTGRNGSQLGLIYVSDRHEGDFVHADESVLVQLAQMGSIGIENTFYAEERQANRTKDEFLATLGHELRTPLTAILGWTELLKLQALEDDVALGVDVIDRNARAQTRLIEDLLDISRITSGKLRMNPRLSTVGPIVKTALDAIVPTADNKGVRLHLDLCQEEICAVVDPDRLQQVVWNLVSNAVKFTPTGGDIFVRLYRSAEPGAERFILNVRDTGIGIDKRFLPVVFDRFRQADSSSTRRQGGLGIGLAIVRYIVDQHGGLVKAESNGVGCGSVFSIEIPAVVGSSTTVPTAIVENMEQTEGTELPSLSNISVLLVDDETDTRDVIAAALRGAGARVVAAASVKAALEALNTSRPNVVVSDIAMPDQDGYALIRQIRRMPQEVNRQIPAIALTAYARDEDRAHALATGFQIHLAKPVDLAELVREIAGIVDRKNSEAPALRWAQ